MNFGNKMMRNSYNSDGEMSKEFSSRKIAWLRFLEYSQNNEDIFSPLFALVINVLFCWKWKFLFRKFPADWPAFYFEFAR